MWVIDEQAVCCPMAIIVAVVGFPLNAHFCQCLACFSSLLEKPHKRLHTVAVEKL
jgi:hypothetical protein